MAWREPHPRRNATPAEVQENKRQIQALDDQIKATIRKIERYTQELVQLRQERANRLSFIAPYRRLPTEILSEIAWHCVEQRMKPSNLNQIDAAMRYAVNGFRALWSRIFVTRSIMAAEKAKSIIASEKYLLCRNPRYLQLLLDRASPSPLTIKIDTKMLIEAIFEVLAPFSAYIKTLKIVDWFSSGPSQLHPMPQLDFRALQDLSLSDTQACYYDFTIHILNTLQKSSITPIFLRLSLHRETFQSILRHPVIRRAIELDVEAEYALDTPMVELGAMPYLRSFTTSMIPYSFDGAVLPSLLYLEARAPTLNFQIDIDDIPNQIQVLELTWYSLCQRYKAPASPRRFPDLYELALSDVSIVNLSPGCIMAPKLEDLTFVDETGEHYRDLIPTLQTFCLDGTLFGSSLLRQLTIKEMELSPEIIPYMRQLNSLEILKLISCRVWKSAFSPLWSDSEHTTLFLPSLTSLVMERSVPADGDHKFTVLRERCTEARPSLKLSIMCSR